MQIEELIPGINLENTTVEFKGIIEEGQKQDGSRKEIGWLKTIAAFANTEGGDLYVGVEDKTHKVVALDHKTADKVILMIHRQIRNRIQPAIQYSISPLQVPDASPARYILDIHVNPCKDLPVTVREGGLLGIYVRNYGETETASPEQIRDMVLMSESIPYDKPFTHQPYSPDHYQYLFHLAAERNIHITDKQLISIGFMSEQKFLSKGALLFDDHCNDSCTRMSMSLWPEYSKGSDIVLANTIFTGNLLEAVSVAIRFVKDHSANGYRKEAEQTVSYISYPERSVTEGIVNAIAHRNYFIQGAQIEINIFRDRLEITSPGSLLGVRKLDKEKDIASIIPRRRNEVICDVLEMCRYMEEKGSGFDKIEEDYQPYDNRHKPYISCDAASFTLTLPDVTYANGIAADSDYDPDHIPEIYALQILNGRNDEKVLAFCYFYPRTASAIADYLGIKPSTWFRKNTLARLVKEGLLRESRQGRSALYKTNTDKVKIKAAV